MFTRTRPAAPKTEDTASNARKKVTAMNVQIIYASIEGQTAKIARFVERQLLEAGHRVALVNALGTSAFSLDNADKIVLAASVHERRHPRLQ